METQKVTETTSELLDLFKTTNYKKCICIAAFSILLLILVLYIYYTYFKDGYMSESVRSDSDRSGWDLRASIESYLKEQNKLLSQRIY